MNKTVVGILIGLLLGAGATWLVLRSHGADAPAKAEAGAAKPEEKEKENPLHVPPAKRTAMGIALAKPTEAMLAPEVTAFGRTLDATGLVTLAAEEQTARTASNASQQEAERTQKLFAADRNASAQAVETTAANAARDRVALTAAQAKMRATWGSGVAENMAEIEKALDAGATLVRLDALPGDVVGSDRRVAHLSLPGGETFDAELLGSAPVADPQVQGASFLALVRGRSLPIGAAVRARIPAGNPANALVVPRSAIVYHQGSAWIFVLGEEDTFERKLVSLGQNADNDGVAIAQGLEAGEQVVTAGAQQLLAAELQAGGAPAEE